MCGAAVVVLGEIPLPALALWCVPRPMEPPVKPAAPAKPSVTPPPDDTVHVSTTALPVTGVGAAPSADLRVSETTGEPTAAQTTGNARLDQFRKHFESLSVRGVFIRAYNVAVISISCICLLLTMVAWGIAFNFNGGTLKRRHVGSIISFIFALATIVIDIISLRVQPGWVILVALQAGSILTLFLNGVSIGMVAITVDVCSSGDPSAVMVPCGANYLEYVCGVFLSICFASLFITTQQKIVVCVDRNILKGLGDRLSRL